MKKTVYQSPEVNQLELQSFSCFAQSGNQGAKVDEMDSGDEIPWTY